MRTRLLASIFSLLWAFAARPAAAFDLVTAFDPTQGELPESITLDQEGNIYLSMSNTIRQITPDGHMSTFATLPIDAFVLGLKVGPDGCVYNASTSLSATPGAFVWRTCTAGHMEKVATLDQSGGPNDLAFDDAGNLYVTDPFLGELWKVTPDGSAAVWLVDPLLAGNPAAPALVFHALGADGIAFDRDKRNLYVGNLDYGEILRIAVGCDGSAGAPEVVVSDPLLIGVDGLAFDKKGTLYAAVGAQDRAVSIAPDGAITILGEGGLLDGPSSFAFGTRGNDKHTLYLTSLSFSRAYGFQPGTPHPALLRMDVTHKGLPLP